MCDQMNFQGGLKVGGHRWPGDRPPAVQAAGAPLLAARPHL